MKKPYNLILRVLSLVLCVAAVCGFVIWLPSRAPSEAIPPETPIETPPDIPSNAGSMDIVDISSAQYTYDALTEDILALSERYADKFSSRSLGRSLDGRELYALTVGNVDAPRTLVITAGVHGREYLTPLFVMHQVEYYLYNYASFDFWDEYSVSVMPMCNPDGIALAQSGLSAIHSEELREEIEGIYADDLADGLTSKPLDEYLKSWKANARGVDINRNFDTEDYGKNPAMKRPCFKNYHGDAAFSEPETRAMRDFVLSLSSPAAVLSIHSQGEVIYFNCGQADNGITENFARAVSDFTKYTLIYTERRDSAFEDWCNKNRGIPSVTVETGALPCPLPISEFDKIRSSCRDLWVLAANYFENNSN